MHVALSNRVQVPYRSALTRAVLRKRSAVARDPAAEKTKGDLTSGSGSKWHLTAQTLNRSCSLRLALSLAGRQSLRPSFQRAFINQPVERQEVCSPTVAVQ